MPSWSGSALKKRGIPFVVAGNSNCRQSPADTLVANWTYLVIAAQAWNLKVWLGLLLPARLGARRLIRMEFRRFVTCVIGLPCQIVTTGRRLLYRLLTVNDWTRLLIEGNLWLKHQQFG